MAEETDIDRCIEALHAVKLTRSYYASSSKGAEIIREIVTTLGGVRNQDHYATVPIRTAVARAIHQAYVGPLPEDLGDQPRPSGT